MALPMDYKFSELDYGGLAVRHGRIGSNLLRLVRADAAGPSLSKFERSSHRVVLPYELTSRGQSVLISFPRDVRNGRRSCS